MENSTILLKRVLQAKDPGFFLIVDSLAQSAKYFIQEFIHHKPESVQCLVVNFEIPTFHSGSCIEFNALEMDLKSVAESLQSKIFGASKLLVLIDSLNHIKTEELVDFISQIAGPRVTLVATLHNDDGFPSIELSTLTCKYPDPLTLTSYIANAIFEISPQLNDDRLQDFLDHIQLVPGVNLEQYNLEFTHRRKSGRSVIHRFHIDSATNTYTTVKKEKDDDNDEELLRDLTTFNLSTSHRQKLARQQVELPFMQAQSSLGALGGAIVYEFEKDDDYDEEDPFEDPFWVRWV